MNTLIKSPEWKAEWQAKIGGGRSAAAAGIHEYMTQLELFEAMINGVELDHTKPDLLRGLLLEPVAEQRLRMVYPDLEFRPHDQTVFIYNDSYPWASDLPDLWVKYGKQEIPVQIKCPTPRNWEKLEYEIPDYIQCNCVHSAAVNNAPAILLACLNPVTMEIYRQIYEPKQEAIDALMEAEERFYNQYIIPRISPPPQTHDDLKLLWPWHAEGKHVTASEEIEEAWSELLAVRATLKHAEERKEDLNFTIKAAMENAEALLNQHGQVIATWKTHQQMALDSKRLREEHPETWAQFAEEKDIRTFLIKQPRGRL